MTWHIHIQGQVQGIGFRPFVFLLAKKFKLKGWVNNTIDGVHIEFNANKGLADNFKKVLVENAPDISHITKVDIEEVEEKNFIDFSIVLSESKGEVNLLLTPDFALCEQCRSELHNITDQRYNYPFTTCINCGPRYSIINELPYDRENTTMAPYDMCKSCNSEYNTPLDRRYYSQTNTCPSCSIGMSLFDSNLNEIKEGSDFLIDEVVNLWNEGEIVAIKGIGGYLLTCDAGNDAVVLKLRSRKHRPSKPFALMYPSMEDLGEYHLTNQSIKELQSSASPIVILDLKNPTNIKSMIAPRLKQVGVMLPYTPLFELLISKYGKPIVATSGNISNSPIVYQDAVAKNDLIGVADSILTNNREIVIPQDDSVIMVTFWKKRRIVLRRSRGLAPTFIKKDLIFPDLCILSMGAMLKSTFSLFHRNNTFISQYLGDLENFEAQESYNHTLAHLLNLFKVEPERILCDKHENYASTRMGLELAEKFNIPVTRIQHHIAHFGAVLGEHNLMFSTDAVLGVIWDGTGIGDDGHVWGGEFFKYEHFEFHRRYHFEYFDFLLGDKMSKEPRISALSTCWDVIGSEELIKEKFSKIEWGIYSKLLANENPLQSSSVGRIFDAVASLLELMDKQTYEGEAAMLLEAEATSYFKNNGLDFSESYFQEGAHYYRIPTKSLFSNIIMDLRQGMSKDFIAAKFHFSMTHIIKIVANHLEIKKIAFSGGVFQNGLLVDLISHHLSNEFELFFHLELSPNDENISFGQQICYQILNQKESLKTNKSNEYVFSNSR